MKTFLWTTLFWIVAAIVWLVCLGFWNFVNPVLENHRLVSMMPNNVQDEIYAKYKALETPEVVEPETINAEADVEDVESSEDNLWNIILSLSNLAANQEIIYSQMNVSFDELKKAIDSVAALCSAQPSENVVEEAPVIDEKEQQRLELQAQIEALQAQMQTL